MRFLTLTVVLSFQVLCLAPVAGAQSADDIVAWQALIRSPIGGTLAAPPAGVAAGERATVSLNYGSWRFGPGDDEFTNLGAVMRFPAGRMSILLIGMVSFVKDCPECGGSALGGGLHLGLASLTPGGVDGVRFDIALQPTANYASWAEGEISSLTAAASLPMSLSFPVGPVTLRPFVSPGFGYGKASDGDVSYGGTRSLLGYGIGIANRSGSIQAHVGTMTVTLKDAPTVTGFGLTVRF